MGLWSSWGFCAFNQNPLRGKGCKSNTDWSCSDDNCRLVGERNGPLARRGLVVAEPSPHPHSCYGFICQFTKFCATCWATPSSQKKENPILRARMQRNLSCLPADRQHINIKNTFVRDELPRVVRSSFVSFVVCFVVCFVSALPRRSVEVDRSHPTSSAETSTRPLRTSLRLLLSVVNSSPLNLLLICRDFWGVTIEGLVESQNGYGIV